jgi:uncharacterized membrane protein/mono/diheme cytochrome c family protein
MADAALPITRRRPYGLTFFGLLAIAGLVSMPIVAGSPGGKDLPDIVRFLGHFHPVVLHLPIGVFILILFQELGLIFFRRSRENAGTSLFPMFFGAASSILAVIAGFLLYHGHGDDYAGQALAERHLWGGLAFAVAAVLTFILKAWAVSLAANPAWYRLMLFGSVGVMGFASHDGASLTHGSGYLTKYAPEPLRKILGLDPQEKLEAEPTANPADPAVYANIVQPILERRCVQCHKPGKIKGKLRMDTFEMLVKGGSEGPAIEPGDSAKSNIVIRIELPEDDDERMPPDGKPGLKPEELAVLKWWIDSGADPAKTLSQLTPPAEIQSALAKLDLAPKEAPKETAAGHAPAKPAVDEKLKATVSGLSKEFPGALSFESQQSPLVTFTAVSLRGKLDDDTFGKLAPVVSNLVTVDLSATNITDKTVAALGAAPKLRQVRLAETAVTDAAIDSLVKVPSLESVNLYGTKVTDAGIAKLAALPNLKRLYVWQTAVTPAGIQALRQKLPSCEIVSGTP